MSLPEQDVLGKAYDARLMKWLWQFVKPHWRLLAIALALIPLSTGFALLQPMLIKFAIDEHIAVQRLSGLGWVVLLYLGAVLLAAAASYGLLYVLQLLGQRSMHAIRQATYAHVLRLRAAYFDRVPTGRVLTRMTNDVESINEMFASGVITIVADAFTLVSILCALLALHWQMALLTFVTLPIVVVLVWWARGIMRTSFRAIRVRLAAMNATLSEHLAGIRVVQIFGRQRHAHDEYNADNAAYRDAYLGAIRADASMYAVVEAVGVGSAALIAWYAGANIGGTLTVGLVVAFIEYVNRFYIPVRDLSAKYAVMQSAMAAIERIAALLETDEPDAPDGEVDATVLPHDRNVAIEFSDVRFSYRPGEEILRGVSFSIKQGETVAVVGATGSGKSTLIRLLTRLYEVEQGAIRFRGQDIKSWERHALRQRITAVSQDVFLFSGTVGENVRLAAPLASDEEIMAALSETGLPTLLSDRGNLLELPVTENAANFSAGEKQLISFARALIRNPEVLVLDEATAQVDPEAERTIEDALLRLTEGRTSLLIAHRLSTIERADRILVMSKGHIAEQGTREELLALNGLYAKLERTFRQKGGTPNDPGEVHSARGDGGVP